MKTFKTIKGTELPIANIKGKDYLQVAHRVQWFREEHPDWCIHTEIISNSEQHAIMKAIISDEKGQTKATAHKVEDTKGFGDFLEKAETGAIGRALALCGYGTQFTTEFDENDRLADAPTVPHKITGTIVQVNKLTDNPGLYVCQVKSSKFYMKCVRDLTIEESDAFIKYGSEHPNDLPHEMMPFYRNVMAYWRKTEVK